MIITKSVKFSSPGMTCKYPLHYVLTAVNLQATKLFIVTSATKKGWLPSPPRFRVRFKILYRVIQVLIQPGASSTCIG